MHAYFCLLLASGLLSLTVSASVHPGAREDVMGQYRLTNRQQCHRLCWYRALCGSYSYHTESSAPLMDVSTPPPNCVLHAQNDSENCLCSLCVLHTQHDRENCLRSAHTQNDSENCVFCLSVFYTHIMTLRIVCVLFVCVLHTQHGHTSHCLCSICTPLPVTPRPLYWPTPLFLLHPPPHPSCSSSSPPPFPVVIFSLITF